MLTAPCRRPPLGKLGKISGAVALSPYHTPSGDHGAPDHPAAAHCPFQETNSADASFLDRPFAKPVVQTQTRIPRSAPSEPVVRARLPRNRGRRVRTTGFPKGRCRKLCLRHGFPEGAVRGRRVCAIVYPRGRRAAFCATGFTKGRCGEDAGPGSSVCATGFPKGWVRGRRAWQLVGKVGIVVRCGLAALAATVVRCGALWCVVVCCTNAIKHVPSPLHARRSAGAHGGNFEDRSAWEGTFGGVGG